MKNLLALLAFLGMLGTAHAQEAVSYPNEGATGTTVGKLAKFTAANPSTAILAATTDVDNIVGIVIAQDATATTGNAKIAVLGPANCTFDASGATAGHYVINSAVTAGACADGGASRPTATQVIGRVTANVAASASGSVNLTIGFTNAAGSGTPANPTATITTSAVNGAASTFMRSDAAPAASQCSASTFGLCKPDGTTITASSGVLTSVGGAATTITPGTTTVVGATAPCLIDNSATTVMGCAAAGTGVLTALGVNVGTAGALIVNGGALGTPSSGTLTSATGLPISTGVSGLGTGVATAAAANLSAAGGLTTTIAAGSQALNTAAIASAACDTVVSATATNVATTDTVTASFNGDPTAVTGYVPATTGMLTIITYPTSGHVNFKVCNNTGGSITPGAITVNWRVAR